MAIRVSVYFEVALISQIMIASPF